MAETDGLMEKIVSLCKRRGFVYPSFEIYGGLAGFYDYGPLGVLLKRNIENLWWKVFVESRDNIFGVDAVEISHQKALEASGHVGGFSDPMAECAKCKHRFRADHLSDLKRCPDCAGSLGKVRQFNMMFSTHIGAAPAPTEASGEDAASVAYLRPETAQGIFVDFPRIFRALGAKAAR